VTAFAGLRAAALAGVALLGIAIALAVSHRSQQHNASTLPAPAGQWYTALAAPYTSTTKVTKSACGVTIDARTRGVAHPVLPCGVKIYLEFDGRQVLTQVIDRGHTAPGRVFDVTPGLAKVLRLQGTQAIRWRFAS
jgi:rare lipoprotein A (peptidoglycan hydrolase)